MMFDTQFDINKLLKTAKELGIKAEANSENPGIHFVSKDGKAVRTIGWDETEAILNEIFRFEK